MLLRTQIFIYCVIYLFTLHSDWHICIACFLLRRKFASVHGHFLIHFPRRDVCAGELWHASFSTRKIRQCKCVTQKMCDAYTHAKNVSDRRRNVVKMCQCKRSITVIICLVSFTRHCTHSTRHATQSQIIQQHVMASGWELQTPIIITINALFVIRRPEYARHLTLHFSNCLPHHHSS